MGAADVPASLDGQSAADSGLSASGLRVVRLGSDEVVAKRGIAEVRMRFAGVADLLARVADLADGNISEEGLVAAFDPASQPDVRRLVAGLRVRGLLHDGGVEDPAELFWRSVASHAPEATARLARASALVIGTGAIADALTGCLVECGVGNVETHAEVAQLTTTWDLCCATLDGPPDGLVPAADAALAAGVVFLPVWLDDLVIRVGPMVHPFDTACLRCYLLRVDANDPHWEVHRLLRGQDGAGHSGAGFLAPMAAVAGQIAGLEAVKQLSGLPVTTIGRSIGLSLVPFRCEVHRVLRVPRCPACSGTARQGAPVVAHGPQLAE